MSEIKKEVERAKREAEETKKRCTAFYIAEIKNDRKEAATSNQSSKSTVH